MSLSVTLKLATSLDGRIATASGQSKWITGPEARAEVHRMRADHDAVLTGIGTVLADDPLLTARTDPDPEIQPVRIIADSQLRLPSTGRLVMSVEDDAPVIVISGYGEDRPFDVQDRADELDALGVDILFTDEGEAGRPSVEGILRCVAALGLNSLMVEAGAGLATAFLASGRVDTIEWFRAPLLLGGDGIPVIGPLGAEQLADVPRWHRSAVSEIGPDTWETYTR
jgi:diaminohydroxyphosphoribosylaminopyrimidine deaminase/5-amino-6-(5-phosphoribosylamino)uracil reductase